MTARFLFPAKRMRRRVAHLTGFDPLTGQPTMRPLCGMAGEFGVTANVPLGRPTCKRCLAVTR